MARIAEMSATSTDNNTAYLIGIKDVEKDRSETVDEEETVYTTPIAVPTSGVEETPPRTSGNNLITKIIRLFHHKKG